MSESKLKSDTLRCRAVSKGTGRPCGRAAIQGGKVCTYHGGKSPQVMMAARQRLIEAASPAAAYLANQLRDKELDPTVRQRAALGILDRAGYGAGSRVEMVGAGGGPVKIEGTPELRHLTDDQIGQLRALAVAALAQGKVGEAPKPADSIGTSGTTQGGETSSGDHSTSE